MFIQIMHGTYLPLPRRLCFHRH